MSFVVRMRSWSRDCMNTSPIDSGVRGCGVKTSYVDPLRKKKRGPTTDARDNLCCVCVYSQKIIIPFELQ